MVLGSAYSFQRVVKRMTNCSVMGANGIPCRRVGLWVIFVTRGGSPRLVNAKNVEMDDCRTWGYVCNDCRDRVVIPGDPHAYVNVMPDQTYSRFIITPLEHDAKGPCPLATVPCIRCGGTSYLRKRGPNKRRRFVCMNCSYWWLQNGTLPGHPSRIERATQ